MVKRNKGNLTEDIYEYDVVLFSMGVNNSMCKGFSYDITLNFPEVYENERGYKYGDVRKYGTIHETECDGILFIACYVCKLNLRKNKKDVGVDYELVDKCLSQVKEKYGDRKIASYILGGSRFDGDGDKKTLEDIVEKHFKDSGDYTLYMSEPHDTKTEMYKKIKTLYVSLKKRLILPDDYMKVRTALEWRRVNGIYKPQPDDYVYVPKSKYNNRGKIRHTKEGMIVEM